MGGAAVKSERLLQIYFRLTGGDVLSKKELAQRFHIAERSVQRDMESLRCFLPSRASGRRSSTTKGGKGIVWNALRCRC